jgi:hypothetical protein
LWLFGSASGRLLAARSRSCYQTRRFWAGFCATRFGKKPSSHGRREAALTWLRIEAPADFARVEPPQRTAAAAKPPDRRSAPNAPPPDPLLAAYYRLRRYGLLLCELVHPLLLPLPRFRHRFVFRYVVAAVTAASFSVVLVPPFPDHRVGIFAGTDFVACIPSQPRSLLNCC